MFQRKETLGERGEKLALRFLQRKGYKILAQNYRCRVGEIDIVAQEGGKIVFIEVKCRQKLTFGPPQAAISEKKKLRLIKIAQFFLLEHHLENSPCRFDVVTIIIPKRGKIKIELTQDAFWCNI
jgi:putative endonuclease